MNEWICVLYKEHYDTGAKQLIVEGSLNIRTLSGPWHSIAIPHRRDYRGVSSSLIQFFPKPRRS